MMRLILLMLMPLLSMCGESQNISHICRDTILASRLGLNSGEYGFIINGFDIDISGVLYFLTTSDDAETVLSKFEENSVQVIKKHNDFLANRIYIRGDSIYTFDTSNRENIIYALNIIDGQVVYKSSRFIDNRVNSYAFYDNKIFVELFDNKSSINQLTETGYIVINYAGDILGQVKSTNGLLGDVSDNFQTKPEWDVPWLLGKCGAEYIYYIFDTENGDNLIIGYNHNDHTYRELLRIKQDDYGVSLYDPWIELIKLRNKKLYWVTYDDESIMINSIDLTEYL